MNIIIPGDICASIEPGSWLWYLAGCGLGLHALPQIAMLMLPLLTVARSWEDAMMTTAPWDDTEYRKLVTRLRTPRLRLFLDNLRQRIADWRTRRQERREGVVVDIRTQLKKHGVA